MTLTKLLMIFDQPVGKMMAGPALRYWELAKVLGRDADVVLAVPQLPDLPTDGFRAATWCCDAPDSLIELAREADAIMALPYLLVSIPALSSLGRPLIVDIYSPYHSEVLATAGNAFSPQRLAHVEGAIGSIEQALCAGDFFICGSERQRDYWLGMLTSCGRINELTYRADPSLRGLIDVVSMGIPDDPPAGNGPLKGVYPGLDPDDFLVVWPGGVWDWLDPLTAIEAVHELSANAPDVKLLFPGLSHPNPEAIASMKNPKAVLRRAEELGMLGNQVLHSPWTPYEQRGRYLLGADVALSLHFDNLETDLAIRVRLLDCLWAGTPVIATRGDVIGEAMAEHGLARLVPPRDSAAVAQAIMDYRLARDGRHELASRFRKLGSEYQWSVVAQPLAHYLRRPRRAADHMEDVTKKAPTLTASPALFSYSVPKRWLAGDLLALPFDQYQRHREAANIVEALRVEPGRPLRVLDVGGAPAVLPRFLDPRDDVLSLDTHPAPATRSVLGHAARLPFADGSFDLVVTLDSIEHVLPNDRLQAVEECLRVARDGVVVIAPFSSPDTAIVENMLFELIHSTLGLENTCLREHIAYGLPDLSALQEHLERLGFPYLVRPSGYVYRWLIMMFLKHYLMSVPGLEMLHCQIDSYYNRYYFEADRRAPAYRSIVYVDKTGGRTMKKVELALGTPADAGPAGAYEVRSLTQLGIFGMQLISILRDRDVQLAGARETIAQRDMQLAGAHQTIAQRDAEAAIMRQLFQRMDRRKIVRAMHLLDSAVDLFKTKSGG